MTSIMVYSVCVKSVELLETGVLIGILLKISFILGSLEMTYLNYAAFSIGPWMDTQT